MAAQSPRGQRSNLPVEVSSFVGRQPQLAEVRRLLSAYRLVTLTGVGGVGKTRLALRSAHELHRAFPDGVWLVDLAGLTDPGLVAHTVAAALGLRDESSRGALTRLAEQLAGRRVLLVLDNCEHLVEPCAVLATALLRACPKLRLLATSRQGLGVDGECTMRVPSLSIPDAEQIPDRPDGLEQYESVRLFVERASVVLPRFGLTAGNRAAVAGLCRRLDGIPLAIELAVGRLRALSVEQILERLEDRYRLLSTGSRAALPRQQTLRALMDWSYDLMSPRERLLWARLSVFAGSFELDAVEGVCADDTLPSDTILELVTELLDKSALLRDERGSLSGYRLLETIREYGRARLEETGAAEQLRARHRDWYGRLVERASAELFGPAQEEWFNRLRAGHANVRVALDYCATVPAEAVAGLRIATALHHYWTMSGSYGEGRSWLRRLLALHPSSDAVRGPALAVAGRLAVLQGDVDEARALLAESRSCSERAGDRTWVAHAAHAEGLAALFWGEPSEATELFEEALAGHRSVGDPFGMALGLVQLAGTALMVEDGARALALCEECLALSATYQERWCAAMALWTQALTVWRQRDLARATTLARDCIRLKQPFGDRMGIAMAMEILAWVAAADGQHERAARLFGAVDAVWRAIGATRFGFLVGEHDGHVTRTRRAVGAKAYDAAYRHGQRLGLDAAVAYAFEEQTAAARARGGGAPAAGVLTRRQAEIAELIAQGLSNKEIAAKLVIAQRTAEGHVEQILARLGFTSRAQVAAWVAEQRR